MKTDEIKAGFEYVFEDGGKAYVTAINKRPGERENMVRFVDYSDGCLYDMNLPTFSQKCVSGVRP